jgi:hypothetical protein
MSRAKVSKNLSLGFSLFFQMKNIKFDKKNKSAKDQNMVVWLCVISRLILQTKLLPPKNIISMTFQLWVSVMIYNEISKIWRARTLFLSVFIAIELLATSLWLF